MISADDFLVRPDTAAVDAAVEAARGRGPDVALDAVAVRAERAARRIPGITRHPVRTRTVPGPAGPVPVRVVGPDGSPTAVHVVAHASGWSVGGPEQDDPLGDALAGAAGIASVSVDYRLAPEHPFPAGLDDVVAVVVDTLERTEVPVVLAGASAGSHLMLLAALRLRQERPELVDRIAGLSLRYGCYDLGGTPSLRRAGPDALVVTPQRNRSMQAHAFPGLDAAGARDPGFSPLYAELAGLPPVRIDVGDRDPLLDDSLFLAARLVAAGVPTELAVWAGCPHVFDALDPRLGDDLAARLARWSAGTRGSSAPRSEGGQGSVGGEAVVGERAQAQPRP